MTRLKRLDPAWIGYILAGLSVLAVGGFLFAWSGLYSVAASRGHWPGFSLVLEFGMRSSVRTHALGIDVPNLDDAAMIERGASHFQGSCALCHGAPGGASNPIVRAMLPEPPDLALSVPTWKANELFWIVKHGLKYTGMPAWPTQQRDDEVWAVVAFLRRLPEMDREQYRALATVEPRRETTPMDILVQGGPAGAGLAACSRCHGLDGKGRPNGAFPRLDILTADYIYAQLQAYAAGTRHSGIMQPVAAELDAVEMQRLADYYAAATEPSPEPTAGRESLHAIGETLMHHGLPGQGIPPCASCHANSAAPNSRFYPPIAGQYASYTEGQLALFKSGRRRGTPAAEIMTVIAQRLTDEQIDGVAAYLAGMDR